MMLNATDTPTIVVDSREQLPLVFAHLPSVAGTLGTADYSVLGFESEVGFERKSISDLIGSISSDRDRFERELIRLRGFRLSRLIVVGHPDEISSGTYRSKMHPKAVWGTLDSFAVRYGVAYEFHATPSAAAQRIERLAWYYWRDYARRFSSVGPCPIAPAVPLTR